MERMIGRTAIGFDGVDTAFTERVRVNQRKPAAELKAHHDFIVCGSGSSDSVVARRLAENSKFSVLLLEAVVATMCQVSLMPTMAPKPW
jgi:ribulose 1,5-bisphosphate synthetase/thiazole synthase